MSSIARIRLAFSHTSWLVALLALMLTACGGGGGGGNGGSAPVPATLSRVEVTPAAGSISAGTQQQYVAMAIYSDDTRQTVTNTVAWSSSNVAVATIDAAGRATGAAPGTATIGATYQGVAGSTTLTVTAATLRSLAVTPSNPSIANGTQQQFMATATFTDSTTQDVTATTTWTSSAADIASISNTTGSNGLAQGLAPGTTNIGAAYQGQTATTALTVTGATATALAVTPTNPSIASGTTRQFVATATFSDSTTQNVTTVVTWDSSDPTIATISNTAGSNGLANALAAGATTISAAFRDQTGSTTLTVTPAALTAISVTPTNPSIANGRTQQFTATGTYADGSTQDITTTVTWNSGTPATATVSNAAGSNGLAQSLAVGTTTVSAVLSGITGSTGLTVTAAVLARIDVTPPNPTVPRGTTQQFTATGVFTDSSTTNLTTSVTWSSSDTNVAAISNAAGSQGLAAPNSAGTATISAVTGNITGNTTITVTTAVLRQIQVTPANPSVARNFTRPFTATGLYSDNSSRDITTEVTWASTSTATATISNADGSRGIATGVAPGTTTISATVGTIIGSTGLTVTAATLRTLGVTPANPSIPLGTGQAFTATGTFTDSSTQDLTTQVNWLSATTATATISNAAGSQGQATSVAPGTTNISATLGSVVGRTVLTVTAAAVRSITVTPINQTIPSGTTQQFTATGTFSDGSVSAITTLVTWASSSATIATISNAAGSQGLARAVAVGSTTISAVYQGVTGSTTLTVSAATLRSIALTPPGASVALGSVVQYAATGTYSDGSTRDVTREAAFDSDNRGVATISSDSSNPGFASTTGRGTTNITATVSDITGTTTLTVTAVTLSSIAVTPADASTPAGTTLQYTATGTYSDNTTQDLTTQVTWSTSSAATADISNAANSQGRALARAAGTTTITATFVVTGGQPIIGSTGLTVTAATLTGITVSPSAANVALGFRQQYTAAALYSDGSRVNVTNQVSWSVFDTSIATIGNTDADRGLLTTVATGSTNVVAALSGVQSSATPVTVTDATLTSITVTPITATTPRGTTLQFTAIGTFSDASVLNLTTQVVWISSSTNIATVSNAAPTQGLATAARVAFGTTTIGARVTSNGNSIIGSATLRVTLN